MDKVKKREIFTLALCILVGFALRFYTFDQKSLWIDEIHTYNDSRDGFNNQLKYYKANPTYLHPPLFFVLTHSFYPFSKPERDLRIFPLIFGVLSIPMMYLLSRQFSPSIAIPCTLSLTFMTYHIYFSQDGRMYSLIMFLGMAALYFLMKYLETLKRGYLLLVAFLFAILIHTSYSTILFIALSQALLLYRARKDGPTPLFSSLFILNGVFLFLCIPWFLFIILNYKGQPIMDPLTLQDMGSFSAILERIFNDWAPHLPLTVTSAALLVLFPFFSRNKKNAFILSAIFILPILGLYLYSKLLNVSQFITSRYFISFLPLFLITLFLSLQAIEVRLSRSRRLIRATPLFLILFIASNLLFLPLYYQSQKQDFRGLVTYLNGQLQDGDNVIVKTFTYIPGILHYFRVDPADRHYEIPFSWKEPGKLFEFKTSLVSKSRSFALYHSNLPYSKYVEDGKRLWIVVGKGSDADAIKKNPSFVLKGYFDGSVAMFRQFPSDASMYLFLWDPRSPQASRIGGQIG
jgi:mannosyltransferase